MKTTDSCSFMGTSLSFVYSTDLDTLCKPEKKHLLRTKYGTADASDECTEYGSI